jgi:transglutaminase-like putative cysteine protease
VNEDQRLESLDLYLKSTYFFDYEHPSVQEFADRVSTGQKTPVESAAALYLAVRDQIRYNPYTFNYDAKTLKASYALEQKQTYCIPKAILLGALARYKGIPSRLGLSDVRNHLASPQFLEWLKTDIFVMHGFIELYLEGRWVVATPAFNQSLCAYMGVEPLEFNGKEDSLFQEYTSQGQRHMEYLKKYGTFAEVPVDLIFETIQKNYPHVFQKLQSEPRLAQSHSLESDLQASSP